MKPNCFVGSMPVQYRHTHVLAFIDAAEHDAKKFQVRIRGCCYV